MKTTLDLPDDLIREIKLRAVREDRKLKDLVAELLRSGLAESEPNASRRRVHFPLFQTGEPTSNSTFAPERIARLLLELDSDEVAGAE
jgi:hypothetical protein